MSQPQTVQSQIKQMMEEQQYEVECPLCLNQYNNDSAIPVIACKNIHCLCLSCLDSICDAQKQKAKCPICQSKILEDKITFKIQDKGKIQILKLKNVNKRNKQKIEEHLQSIQFLLAQIKIMKQSKIEISNKSQQLKQMLNQLMEKIPKPGAQVKVSS